MLKRILNSFLVMVAFATYSTAQTEFSVFEKSISEIQQALAEGRTTSVEVVEEYLARISAYDKLGPRLNSIVSVNGNAVSRAAELDE